MTSLLCRYCILASLSITLASGISAAHSGLGGQYALRPRQVASRRHSIGSAVRLQRSTSEAGPLTEEALEAQVEQPGAASTSASSTSASSTSVSAHGQSPLSALLRQALGEELPSASTAAAAVGILVAALLALARGQQILSHRQQQEQQEKPLTHGITEDRSFSVGRLLSVEQCGQLAICDAHARYNDFGIIALPLVYIFPGGVDARGEPSSPWQEAAMSGKARQDCGQKYSSCLLNPLLIAKFIMTLLT